MTAAPIGSPEFAPEEVLTQRVAHDLDLAVTSVAQNKQVWAETTCEQRIELLNALLVSLQSAAENWVQLSCQAKGHRPNTPAAGEEWLTGPCLVARNLRLLRESISDIAKTGKPRLPAAPLRHTNGQVIVPTFPTSFFDKVLFQGFTAEVWMQAGVTLDNLPDGIAVSYGEHANRQGATCLVLSAGNISSIGPMDAIYKLFVESQVVVVKMNPVNDYLTDSFRIAFEPLIQRGFMAIVQGGAAAGKYLCEHETIDEIHITGSDKTHDAIVYGTGSRGVERKRNREPVCQKRITSELGNVSPVILVPGFWSKSEIAFQAENVASMLVNNAGFNCNSIRVLVTHAGWSQRDEFITALKAAFERIPTRRAYYPGAADRHARFINNRKEVSLMGSADGGALPWTIIHDPQADSDTNHGNGNTNNGNTNNGGDGEICFTTEAFCSVMAETSITADSVTAYIEQAVAFANHRVWGTLSAAIIVSPQTLKQRDIACGVDQAIADLEFGTVAINHWPGLNFGLCSTTWGAFPGHPPHDIQSGTGVVHNTYMFARPQKTVLRGPFKAFPKPVWFATHRRTHKIGKSLYRFECAPSLLRIPGVLIHAIG